MDRKHYEQQVSKCTKLLELCEPSGKERIMLILKVLKEDFVGNEYQSRLKN